MALQKSIELPTGVTVPNAYCRISEIRIAMDPNQNKIVNINIQIFLDKDARDTGKAPVTTYQSNCASYEALEESTPVFNNYFSVEAMAQNNIITNAYKYLKEQQQYFMNSTDC